MVFSLLADWKVQALIIGIVEERSKWLLCGWWVVGWKSDWMTRPTQHRVLYQVKSSSIVTNWSCRHPFISHHQLHNRLMCPVYDLSLGQSNPVSGLFIRWVSRSLSHDVLLLCFIILSLTICHMPLCLLIIWPLIFPWPILPLFLLIHLFSWPTSFLDQPANCYVPTFILLKQSQLWNRFTSQPPDKITLILHTLFDAFVSLLLCYL